MNDILNFFENLSNPGKLIWITICLGIFWILEGVYPLKSLNYNKLKHSRLNLLLLGSTILINAIFGIITTGIIINSPLTGIGILTFVEFPLWVELLFAIMILDLIAQYFVHFLLHKIKFMWKFHMVHHSDTSVDVTTGTRHHPGDYVMREIFSLIAIIICGMPYSFYIIYRILTIFFTYFSHSNLRLSLKVDKAISYLFISPNMHKFHHHYERPWTDSNYGNIFSIWDRVFGTFVYTNTEDIKYGLDVLEEEKSDDIKYQLSLPFNDSIKTDY